MTGRIMTLISSQLTGRCRSESGKIADDIMNEQTPVSRSGDLAFELKRRIRAGKYAPGQRLVEVDISAEFGVGRGRVREVFRTLVGEGYLEFVENRGVLVRKYSREEILQVGRAREVLEGLSARLLAERELTDEERRAIEASQAEMDEAESKQDYSRFSSANRDYHRLLSTMAGNTHVLEFLERLRIPLFRVQLPQSFVVDSIAHSNRDHHVITQAILMGNPDAAEAAMRTHVRAGNAHISKLSDDYF